MDFFEVIDHVIDLLRRTEQCEPSETVRTAVALVILHHASGFHSQRCFRVVA